MFKNSFVRKRIFDTCVNNKVSDQPVQQCSLARVVTFEVACQCSSNESLMSIYNIS